MIGRRDAVRIQRSLRLSVRGAILALGLLGAFPCASPVVAQTASPAPDSQPAAIPPAGASAAPLAPTQAAPETGAKAAATPAQAASLPPHLTDALLPSALPRDLSPWGMFLSAVVPVKIVMVGLALASLATWTVWLAKTIELWNAKRQARRDFEILAHATSLRAAEKARPRAVPHRAFCRGRGERGRAAPRALPLRASRTAPPPFCRASRRMRAGRSCGGPGFSRRSARRRLLSAFLAPSGESWTVSSASRRPTPPISRWWRPASPRLCSRPPWGSSRPFRRS